MSLALSLYLKHLCPLLRLRITSTDQAHILLTDSPRISKLTPMPSLHTPQDRQRMTTLPVLPGWASITHRGTPLLSQDQLLKYQEILMHMHLPLQDLTTSHMTLLPSLLVLASKLLTLSLSLELTTDPSMKQVLNLDRFLSPMLDHLAPHVPMTTMVNHQTPPAHPQIPTRRLQLHLVLVE